MGLDMHLQRETYLSNYPKRDEETSLRQRVGITGIDDAHIIPSRIITITEEIAYWRKANAIHGWFVREIQGGVDECQRADVRLEQLKELKSLCERVLENNSLAEELLSPQSGFFFGSYDIDEWYLDGLEYTRDMLNDLFNEPKPDDDYWTTYHYQSSW